MALPTTISGDHGYRNRLGPFLSSSGNVYVVLTAVAAGSTPTVFKATDPTSSFSEVDAVNKPVQAAIGGPIDVIQSGDILSIIAGTNSSTPAYKFHQFSMATDAWSTTKDKAVNSPSLDIAPHGSCSVVKRSDGSFVAVFNSEQESIKGTSYGRISYATSTDAGVTWSAATAVSATGIEQSFIGVVAVLGASDRTHIFYANRTLADGIHRSLSSANVLDAAANIVSAGASLSHNLIRGISYVSGGNTVVKVSVWDSVNTKLTAVWFNSGADPTFNTEADYTDSAVALALAIHGPPAAAYALDGTTTHSVWSDATSGDLMHDSQTDGGAWGSDVNEWLATINVVSANIYTRAGSKVLAVILEDGGTVKYNEISLAGPTEGLVFTGQATLRVPVGIFAKTVQAQLTLGS